MVESVCLTHSVLFFGRQKVGDLDSVVLSASQVSHCSAAVGRQPTQVDMDDLLVLIVRYRLDACSPGGTTRRTAARPARRSS